MYLVSLLPRSLLVFILATFANGAPTTAYDPFHAIATLAQKPQEEPICCLRPLTPLGPVDDDFLLSFEEWKAKQLAESQLTSSSALNASAGSAASSATGAWSNDSGGEITAEPPLTTSLVDLPPETEPSFELPSPHFRIPLTDRYNYASLDCSARVHSTHRGAKSAANILSSKKDRYLLSPCADTPQFVVIELCDDIWIDTVQLANYEFFSGVFKDLMVSVAKTYAANETAWTVVGTYTAKNVRGVQSFHPPDTLRDFYRFMRIDFHSHYGNEYYCPISLLRVYGLTHLEQWKWDVWENESKQKQMTLEADTIVPSSETVEPPPPVQTPVATELDSMPTIEHETGSLADEESPTTMYESTESIFRHSTDIAKSESPLASTSEPSSFSTTAPMLSSTLDSTHTPETPHAGHSSASETSSAPKLVTPTISLSPAAPPAYLSSSGESIYRTIMNRLTALEANTTLYARYVGEQTSAMRDALRRMTEDVGRLEGMSRARAQEARRTLDELTRQRRRMEIEQRALVARVAALADDVALEKRLGVAQLCLLLAVLVFLSLTRGSRGEYADPQSFPAHWAPRFRARSLTPARTPVLNSSKNNNTNDLSAPASPCTAHLPGRPALDLVVPKEGNIRQRARTPSRRHSHVVHTRGLATPTASRPMAVQRTNSHGSTTITSSVSMLVGPVPRSAKRWARTAHLHEVRPRSLERVVGTDASARLNTASNMREAEGEAVVGESGEEAGWIDTDDGS